MLLMLFATRVVNKHMRKAKFRFKGWLNYIITMTVAAALILLGGMSLWTVKGCILCLILLYASVSDLTNREADNWLGCMILILSLVGFRPENIVSMSVGAVVVFIPELLVEMFWSKKIHFGGADMKISAATAFLLGYPKGVFGFMLGLFIAIVWQLIYDKVKHRSTKEPFPLLPYLSVGLMIGYLI